MITSFVLTNQAGKWIAKQIGLHIVDEEMRPPQSSTP